MLIQGNVQRQDGRPLPGVGVSNGETVVLSGEDGQFRLEAERRNHPFIFALRPQGFLGGHWFVSTPEAEGRSVDLELDVTPGLPAQSDIVRIGHITDIHLNLEAKDLGAMTPHMLLDDLEWMKRTTPGLDLVVAGGDLTNRGDTQDLEALKWAFAHSPVPVMPMYGGHDGLVEKRVPDSTTPHTRYWEQVLGPTYYAFDVGEWLVILYQDEDRWLGPERAAVRTRWLQAVLATTRQRRIAVCTHRHPELDWVEMLAGHGVEIVFYGHWHSSRCFSHKGVRVTGTPALPFGGIDTMPRGYRLIELGPGRPRIPYIPYIRQAPQRPADAGGGRHPGCDGMRIEWTATAGGHLHRGTPLVADGMMLVPVADEDGEGRAGVLCLDTSSGEQKWRYGTEHSVRAGLAAADDIVVTVTQTGDVVALDRFTGNEKWIRRLSGYPDRWIYTAPQVVDDTVAAGTAGGMEAFDLYTGERRWEWNHEDYAEGRFRDAWPHYGMPCTVDGAIPMMVHLRGVSLLDGKTGTARWHFPSYYTYALAPVILCRGNLLIPDRPNMYRLLYHAVDPDTGRALWSCDLSAYEVTGWSVDDEILALNTGCHRLRPNSPDLDPDGRGATEVRTATNGELLWRHEYDTDLMDMGSYQRGMANALCPPMLTTGAVYLAGIDGRLRKLARTDGRLFGELDLGEPIMAGAVIDDTALVLSTYAGQVVRVAIG